MHIEHKNETYALIKRQISHNKILLYMKGTPDFPECGFSAKTVEAVRAFCQNFSFVNVLQYPDIRKDLPKYSDWPTFPQLYINGDFIGGCDIVVAMKNSGELQNKMQDFC